jgi:pyruvate dehydrogenase E2 component (dihydrolipoamide acetyltransferase)
MARCGAPRWLAAANAQRPVTERLLMATLQLKAVALALQGYPDLNGFFLDGAHQGSTQAHVGVAIALRQGGLIAPALHDVAAKPLEQLMRELADLVRRARRITAQPEMSDPTITVTNRRTGRRGRVRRDLSAAGRAGRLRPSASAPGQRRRPVGHAGHHRQPGGGPSGVGRSSRRAVLAALRERLQRPAEL